MPTGPAPGLLTVSCLGRWQTPFCEGLYTCPGTHRQADAYLTQPGHPVPTLTVRSKWQATDVHAASRPCRHGPLWALTHVPVCRREREAHGVCTYVFNAEGKGGGRSGKGRDGAPQQTTARWHGSLLQQSRCRRFTFREGSARPPCALPSLTLLPGAASSATALPWLTVGQGNGVQPARPRGLLQRRGYNASLPVTRRPR